MTKLLLSIVIPVYNGEHTIHILFERIMAFCKSENISFEVIFVWDCGQDNSWEVICKLKQKYPETIKAIQLSRNFGQHNALICGFEHALGEFIITMDEDLQQDPFDIKLLLSTQNKGDFDVVYGKISLPKHSRYRNLTSSLLKKLLRWGIPELHVDYSPLRLIKKNIAALLPTLKNSYTFLDGYLTWITQNVSSVNVNHHDRVAGKSSYTTKKLVEHSINIFVTFSKLPIRLLTFSSIIIFIITMVYSVILFFRKIYGDIEVAGYASISIIIGLGVGAIMAGLGIMGEYLFRVNQKTTMRPTYIVKEKK